MDITKQVTSVNPTESPIQDTHFWQWLDKGNWDDYAYNAIHAYLRDNYLYERGVDTCDKRVVEVLFLINSHFTYTVMRPIWSIQ